MKWAANVGLFFFLGLIPEAKGLGETDTDLEIEPVWIVSGECEVDPADASCVMSSRFPDAFEGMGNCTLHFPEGVARPLNISSFHSDGAGSIFIIEGTYCTFDDQTIGFLEGQVLRQSILWTATNGNGSSSWRVCAGPPVEEDDGENSTENETYGSHIHCPMEGIRAEPPCPPLQGARGNSASIYEEGKKLSADPYWCIGAVSVFLAIVVAWQWRRRSKKWEEQGRGFSKRKARSAPQIPIVFTFSAALTSFETLNTTTPCRVSASEAATFYRCGECRTVAEVVGAVSASSPVRYACPSCGTVNELQTAEERSFPIEEP